VLVPGLVDSPSILTGSPHPGGRPPAPRRAAGLANPLLPGYLVVTPGVNAHPTALAWGLPVRHPPPPIHARQCVLGMGFACMGFGMGFACMGFGMGFACMGFGMGFACNKNLRENDVDRQSRL
jgi:hypothetical protein